MLKNWPCLCSLRGLKSALKTSKLNDFCLRYQGILENSNTSYIWCDTVWFVVFIKLFLQFSHIPSARDIQTKGTPFMSYTGCSRCEISKNASASTKIHEWPWPPFPRLKAC